MGSLIYDGHRYEMEDMMAQAYKSIISSINKLGRTEWLPFPDWAVDGSRVVNYLLIAPGVPVSIQVADAGTGGQEFGDVLRRYTEPA